MAKRVLGFENRRTWVLTKPTPEDFYIQVMDLLKACGTVKIVLIKDGVEIYVPRGMIQLVEKSLTKSVWDRLF